MNYDEHTPIRQRHKDKVLGFYEGQARRPASRDEALVLRTAAEVTAYGGVTTGTADGQHWTADAPETIRDIIAAVDPPLQSASFSACRTVLEKIVAGALTAFVAHAMNRNASEAGGKTMDETKKRKPMDETKKRKPRHETAIESAESKARAKLDAAIREYASDDSITVRGILLVRDGDRETFVGSDGGDVGMVVRTFRMSDPIEAARPWLSAVHVSVPNHGTVSFQAQTGATAEDATERALATYHASMALLAPTRRPSSAEPAFLPSAAA